MLLHNMLEGSRDLIEIKETDAHCDIPCKIYDPGTALISALTVVRMIDIMNEWKEHKPGMLSERFVLSGATTSRHHSWRRIRICMS